MDKSISEKIKRCIFENLNSIRDLSRLGKSPFEISKKLGIRTNSLIRHVKGLDAEIDSLFLKNGKKSPTKDFLNEKKQEFLELVNKGLSSVQIAEQYKTSSAIIAKIGEKLGVAERIRENGQNRQSHLKVSLKDIDEMLRLSELGQGVDLIGRKLGYHGTTIMSYLRKKLGNKEYEKRHNKKKFTTYWSGRFYKNDRGDILQSSLEEDVADWLFENGIKYKTHNALILNGKRYHPDFKLLDLDIYIEIFGMSNQRFYRVKMDKKIADYKQSGIRCIYLYYENFFRKQNPYKKVLEKELKEYVEYK